MLLGVNYSGMHDSAVALLSDSGVVIRAVSEERLSRVKKDGRIPRRALSTVPWGDVAEIVVPYSAEPPPFLGPDRLFDATLLSVRRAVPPYPRKWHDQIGALPRPVSYVDHHEAHAYAAFHLSGWPEALAITCDNGAYNCDTTLAVYHVDRGGLRRLHAASYFCYEGICSLYNDATALLGFQPCAHEGKVTGLAAHGAPSADCRAQLWAVHQEVRRHRLPLCTWVGFLDEDVPAFVDVNEFLRRRWRQSLDYSDADLARAAQDIYEHAMLTVVDRVAAEHGTALPLLLSGGGFANVKLNMEITLRGFPAVFVCPPMGDEGLAIGGPALRLAQSNRGGDQPPPPARPTMFLGADTDDDAPDVLVASGLAAEHVLDLAAAIADALAGSQVVAIARGRAEFGPRALGNRSVLYQATDSTVNDWLNRKLNRTEFMPFAPMLRIENASRSFDDAALAGSTDSAFYMTVCLQVRAEFAAVHPAVVHVDGTARPQFVSRDSHPVMWELLRRYEDLTGAWAIINTSFNMHDETIVDSGADALAAFFTAGLDVLVLGDWMLTREGNDAVAKGAALVRRGLPEDRVRRAAHSMAVGRLLDDLVAANDGVAIRYFDPDLNRPATEDAAGGADGHTAL